jgi:hypothetical protein
MAITVNEQVMVRKPQLHGRVSEIKRGMVVSVSPEKVMVQFPGEFKAEAFPVDQVSSAQSSFGLGSNVDNPYEKPIPKLYR